MINGTNDNSTAIFKNAHRVIGNNNNFLNRTTNEKEVVWIDITDNNGKFNQIAVGFYTGATDNYDRMYDAINVNTGNGFCLLHY